MFFCMAEYCDTLQSKEERNREYKLCLSRGTILHLLDVRHEADVGKLANPAWPKPNQQAKTELCAYGGNKICEAKGWRIVGHNESEGLKLRNLTKLHRAKVCTSLKPASLHALIGECDGGVPESKAMAGNSTVHIGTWESHIVPNRSFQQAEEARRKYDDMAVGPGRIRGVDGVMPIESREPGTLEGPGSKM
jgi:hypothetical protein